MTEGFRSSREIILRTEDWDRATAFYRSVLGLPVTYQSESLMGFETGAFCLYVEKGSPHGPVFELFVHDVEATKAQLISAGCTLVEEEASIPRCYIQDPFGFVFNLHADARG